MPEKQEEPPKTLISKYDASSLLKEIDKRLAQANSPQDMLTWAQARREVIESNEHIKNQNHRRSLEKIQLLCNMGFSIFIFGVGTVLISNGFVTPGCFILGVGAGLWGFKHGRGKKEKNGKE